MRLNILGAKWESQFQKTVICENVEVAGTSDNVKKLNLIATELTELMTKSNELKHINEVFYHEFLHAVFFEAGVDDLSCWNIDLEHVIIGHLQKALAKNFPMYN